MDLFTLRRRGGAKATELANTGLMQDPLPCTVQLTGMMGSACPFSSTVMLTMRFCGTERPYALSPIAHATASELAEYQFIERTFWDVVDTIRVVPVVGVPVRPHWIQHYGLVWLAECDYEKRFEPVGHAGDCGHPLLAEGPNKTSAKATLGSPEEDGCSGDDVVEVE